jgi:hypothetical protein
MSLHINYIKDHLEAISEKKKRQTLEIINYFSEIKENDSINKFIQERIEFVYINEKLDINTEINAYVVISEFRKWCMKNYGKEYELLDDILLKKEFTNFSNLGPIFDENSWIGIKLKE